ncbi:MAG: glycosyltransferase family 4 protein [Bryobacteraceae bacterium]|nr:glycosyltransferase family 4 protein [Bryobacterales bacterium]MEB2359730.1 glycosyltransferase family 4 protein [Bryobacterales bacterium]NUN00743.1 glycosyltransferase family 4 protein [Bryobacteraceae bacterium]
MKFCFLTSTPQNVTAGSGTFRGIHVLASALRGLGHSVEVVTPEKHCRIFTLERLRFNESLRRQDLSRFDLVVGFDLDGYRIAGRGRTPHVAAIKGVIADELRFERGITRTMLSIQAACERLHVQRAAGVITTSEYAAEQLKRLYRFPQPVHVVPEMLDLAQWRELLDSSEVAPDPNMFSVLTVCRFYPRKRLDLLLRAAALLRERIGNLRFRIVGGGPESKRLRELSSALRLEGMVEWLGDVTQARLAAEYTSCDVFCLPSLQEGFGIVLLEAMAAGKPVVAARAAAIPEVVPEPCLVEPGDAQALASAIEQLYRSPDRRCALAERGSARVQCFDAPKVAVQFVDAVNSIVHSTRQPVFTNAGTSL